MWTEPSRLRLMGTAEGAAGELLAATVLPDTVKMEPLVVAGGLLDAELTPPDGLREVWVLPPDASLAPTRLGVAALGQPELVGLSLAFAPAATVTGRMTGPAGAGVPGEVRVEGALGGVLEARAQWLGGTDHDPWITVNEWGQSSASDGSFSLGGLPAGSHTITLRAVGCAPQTLQLGVVAGEAVDLGAVQLEPLD